MNDRQQPASAPLHSADPGIVRKLRQAVGLHRQGRLEDAGRLYRDVLAETPNQPDALHFLGVLAAQRGDSEMAAELIGDAISADPSNAAAHYNLGNALRDLKRFDEALMSYESALLLRRDHFGTLINRGAVLEALKRPMDALASYDLALGLNPQSPEPLYNRANVFRDLGRLDEALASYDRVLQLEPRHESALNNRGSLLMKLLRFDAAVADFDRVLAIAPSHVEALINRGNALCALKRFAQAIEDYKGALQIKPDLPYMRGDLVFCKLNCCDWSGLEQDKLAIGEGLAAGMRVVQPGVNLAVSSSLETQLQSAGIWASNEYPSAQPPYWHGERYCHDRIRVAYLSSDFRTHAVATLIAGVLEHHDKAQFETIGISLGPGDDGGMRKRIAAAFGQFIDVAGRRDADVAAMLREMEIDIAVDLNGYTSDARTGILAFKPAPAQVNYLGYPGTMAAPYMDYIIADRTIIPPAHQPYYSEQVVYLPHTYQPNDRERPIAERMPTRAEAGLPPAAFVFACFNTTQKIGPDMFGIWMRLLSVAQNSVLWLLGDNADASENLRREAATRLVDPNRLIFAPRQRMEDHLSRQRLADLFLDTLPYNAHTTASEALWAGLPVITCAGDTFAARVAASLLHAIGLPELVTSSLGEYEELASMLAREPGRLTDIKDKLARNRDTHPLFDTPRYTRDLEQAYRIMWERAERSLPPASFAVGHERP